MEFKGDAADIQFLEFRKGIRRQHHWEAWPLARDDIGADASIGMAIFAEPESELHCAAFVVGVWEQLIKLEFRGEGVMCPDWNRVFGENGGASGVVWVTVSEDEGERFAAVDPGFEVAANRASRIGMRGAVDDHIASLDLDERNIRQVIVDRAVDATKRFDTGRGRLVHAALSLQQNAKLLASRGFSGQDGGYVGT